MTVLGDLFSEIETPQFDARVNLASDVRVFLRILRADQAVTELVSSMRSSQAAASDVVERVNRLALVEGEDGFAHPADSAIATYVATLYWVGSPWAGTIARVVGSLPDAGWSGAVARVVGRDRSTNQSTNASKQFGDAPSALEGAAGSASPTGSLWLHPGAVFGEMPDTLTDTLSTVGALSGRPLRTAVAYGAGRP